MPLPFVTARGCRGGAFAAAPAAPVGGVSYDQDAQTYFTALEAASGWSEPADYADKKLAISNFVKACKDAGNWEKIKALYIPIWQVAGPNALSAKRSESGVSVTTYDLTFSGTVTHNNGDYIQGDGSTGYATAPFEGPNGSPTFMSLTDFSYSGNVLGGTLTTYDTLLGWFREAVIMPSANSTSNVWIYTWKYATYGSATSGGADAFWSVESQTPTGANTNKHELWKDGTSVLTKESTTNTIYSSLVNWTLLAAGHSTPTQHSQYQVNFAHVGQKMASQSDFNSDAAVLFAAL